MGQCRLRDAVSDAAAARLKPGHRADIDDPPAAGLAHDRPHRPRAEERASRVGVHDPRPELGRESGQVGERDGLVEGGVVDQDVDAAEARLDPRDEAVDLVRISHVGSHRLDVARAQGQQLGR